MKLSTRVRKIAWAGGFLCSIATPSHAETPFIYKVDPVLQAKAQTTQSVRVNVLVRYQTMPTQADINLVNNLGGQIYRSYGRMPMMAICLPVHALNALANIRTVEFVSIDKDIDGLGGKAQLAANAVIP